MYEEKENAHTTLLWILVSAQTKSGKLMTPHARWEETGGGGGVKADKLSREINYLALAPSTADMAMTNCCDKFVQLQRWWVTLVKVAAITHLTPTSRL